MTLGKHKKKKSGYELLSKKDIKDVIENKSTTLDKEDISSNSLQLKGLF